MEDYCGKGCFWLLLVTPLAPSHVAAFIRLVSSTALPVRTLRNLRHATYQYQVTAPEA